MVRAAILHGHLQQVLVTQVGLLAVAAAAVVVAAPVTVVMVVAATLTTVQGKPTQAAVALATVTAQLVEAVQVSLL